MSITSDGKKRNSKRKLTVAEVLTVAKALAVGIPPSQLAEYVAENIGVMLTPDESVRVTDQAWEILFRDAVIDKEKERARKKVRLDLLFMAAMEARDYATARRVQADIDKVVETTEEKPLSKERRFRIVP